MEPIRVLVVDDDDAFLDFTRSHLRKKGFQVESAKDGLDAIQVLRSSGPFSVLVTDLMMPGLSGLELLRRARKLDPSIEVIVITAAGSIELAISALRENGAFDYLTKPFEIIGELSLAVERAANYRQLRLERESMRGSLVKGARRLEQILTSTGDAVIAANEKNELILATPAAASLLNRKPENGKTPKCQIPDILLQLLEGWRSLGNNRVGWVEVVWPDGKIKLVRLAPMPLESSVGWVMVIRDITYIRSLETFIFRDFAKVATKIRQPMEKAVMVISDLENNLREGIGNPHEQIDQLRQLFEIVQDGSNDLFSLSGNGSEPMMKREEVDLTTFLEKTQNQVGTSIGSTKDLQLRWNIAHDLPQKTLDHSLMAQLFHHLLQYAELCSRDPGEIELSCWEEKDSIWLVSTDSRPVNFDLDLAISPFFLDNTQLNQLDRAQIELAVVKSLVNELGGQMWLSQAEGGGFAIAICFSD